MTQENITTFLDFMTLEDGSPIVPIELFDWLVSNKFFDKPAAIRWHGNFSGGLFRHSLAVAHKLVCITKELNLTWQDKRSPYIVGVSGSDGRAQ